MTGRTGSNHPEGREFLDKVRQLQRRLWRAAKRQPGRRFHALLDRIYRRDVLWEAWRRVKQNRGAAGVDAMTLAAVEHWGVEAFLDDLGARLHAGTYRPSAVRRRYIPKVDGRQRPLGIPTVRDRVAQMAATRGMGQVYRARDTKLDRDVAIKILPEAFAHDADRLARSNVKPSGPLWEHHHRRVYFLQRWPSQRAMQRVRQRVKALTCRAVCHRDLRDTIAQLNPVLRGWGAYLRTGNAAIKFGQLEDHVAWRLKRLLLQRHRRQLRRGQADQWTPSFFHALGLVRLRGTIRYPEAV